MLLANDFFKPWYLPLKYNLKQNKSQTTPDKLLTALQWVNSVPTVCCIWHTIDTFIWLLWVLNRYIWALNTKRQNSILPCPTQKQWFNSHDFKVLPLFKSKTLLLQLSIWNTAAISTPVSSRPALWPAFKYYSFWAHQPAFWKMQKRRTAKKATDPACFGMTAVLRLTKAVYWPIKIAAFIWINFSQGPSGGEWRKKLE